MTFWTLLFRKLKNQMENNLKIWKVERNKMHKPSLIKILSLHLSTGKINSKKSLMKNSREKAMIWRTFFKRGKTQEKKMKLIKL
jgi:hypothetical protein